MSYRFQRLVSNPAAYLTQFYARRPGLSERSYAEQHHAHMANAMERSDSYSVELQKRGYETDEIIVDAAPLQYRWAYEHGLAVDDEHWMVDIALAQIRAFKPDVLFITTWLADFGPEFIARARSIAPSIRLVIGWVGEARPRAGHFRAHDLILTCAPDTMAFLQAQGIPARHLNHAFDPRVLDRLAGESAPDKPLVDLGFIGHVFFGEQYHNTRAQILYEIAQRSPLTIYGSVSNITYQKKGLRRVARAGYYSLLDWLSQNDFGAFADRLPRAGGWRHARAREPYVAAFDFLRRCSKPPVYGLEMYATLSGFKVCLNAHGPSAYASNMRLFESTGVGTALLTDWKSNLAQLFEPDVEVATYTCAAEAVEKANYLLAHEDVRHAMAKAGQQRTLRDHTTAQRVEQLHDIITEWLSR